MSYPNEEQRYMVTAENTLSRGSMVILLIGDVTAFVWATLGKKT